VTSRFRERYHELTYTETFPVYILGLLFLAMFSPIGGLLERRVGFRRTILTGGAMMVSATFASYFAIVHESLGLFFVTAGALFGAGAGLALVTPLVVGYRWLPRHKGLVSGIICSGYGGGALVFDQVASRYVNPDNVALQEAGGAAVDDAWDGYVNCDAGDGGAHVCARVASMYLVLGVCYAALLVVGVLVMADPPDDLRDPLPNGFIILRGSDALSLDPSLLKAAKHGGGGSPGGSRSKSLRDSHDSGRGGDGTSAGKVHRGGHSRGGKRETGALEEEAGLAVAKLSTCHAFNLPFWHHVSRVFNPFFFGSFPELSVKPR
jgi:MFS family permease